MVGAEFLDRVNFYKTTWLPARDIVLRALNARTEVAAIQIQIQFLKYIST